METEQTIWWDHIERGLPFISRSWRGYNSPRCSWGLTKTWLDGILYTLPHWPASKHSKKNKTKHSVTGNWGFRKNNDQRSLSWWLLLNDFVQMQQSVDRWTTFIHQLLTQRVSLCSAVSTLHSHSTYGEISSWHRRRSNAHDIRDWYNITFCCSRLRPPSSSIFFPILNLKRLKALLINRCKSSLWKKKTELSLTLSTFLSEMKIINNLALGSQRAVHWHRLHEQRQRKLKCTFHYYNNLHDQTLSSEHAIGHHDIWKKSLVTSKVPISQMWWGAGIPQWG